MEVDIELAVRILLNRAPQLLRSLNKHYECRVCGVGRQVSSEYGRRVDRAE